VKKINLGLIGLGYIGKVHLRNCLRLKSANLTAVCDISKKALKYAREMGVKKTYTDYTELLKDKMVDAVIISLPTFLHQRCVEESAESRKDIFLEKPMARNEIEGKKILKSTRKYGVKLMIGYPLRFVTEFLNLKEEMENGLLGDVQAAHAVLVGSGPFLHRSEKDVPKPVPEWWFKKELTGGGALIDAGCHIINLLRWYFGEITDVKSILSYRFNLDVEDFAMCLMKFKSGTISCMEVGWFSQRDLLKIEMHGTVRHAYARRKAPSKVVAAIQQLLSTSKFWVPYVREIEHFVECIIHDNNPVTSGEDAVKDLEAISLAYKNRIFLK